VGEFERGIRRGGRGEEGSSCSCGGVEVVGRRAGYGKEGAVGGEIENGCEGRRC
jgi:hypothetical protein